MTKRRRRGRDSTLPVVLLAILVGLIDGYEVSPANVVLLYTTTTDVRITNSSNPTKSIPIVENLDQGTAIDFYYDGKLICWSEQEPELIQCASYDGNTTGNKVKVVYENVVSPSGIAIDWYTGNLYWTDGESNKIEVTTIDGKSRKVLFWSDIDLARAIAVLPSKGLLFWTDWGEIPKIEKAGMNGDPKTRKVIVNDDLYWPNGLSIDYNTETIYWLDGKLKFIDAMDINGGNRRRIVKSGLVYAIALTFYKDKLYWTDWKTWAIHSYDISTGGAIKNLLYSDPVPMDIRVYERDRQPPPPTPTACQVNNGNCSHLCLIAPYSPGFTCACPTGIKFIEGSSSQCANEPTKLLVVAQRATISKISLDSPDYTPNPIPLRGIKRAISVDYDYKTEYIYWADNIVKSISRAKLDGSEQSPAIKDMSGVDSIAIDSQAGNLYWTDPVTDTITVSRLDGSSRKVVIHSELYEPRAIALHPSGGLMFWSDWSERRPKIERASLDGSARTLLVAERLAWPNGIALDVRANKLYWGDARIQKIEMCNMDGTDRKVFLEKDIFHIFGLTLLSDRLYWSDMQRRTLESVNKNTGTDREVIVEQLANMMGLKGIEKIARVETSRCALDNANCSHLCFNRPTDVICGCPLGLELSRDNKTCVQPEAYLLYARKNIIGRISIEHPSETNEAILPLREVREVSALAIHYAGSRIYWADSKSKTINRCLINGTQSEKILDNVGIIEGMAIDWIGENLYWIDATSQRIEVARTDGSNRRSLIWQGLKKPKSIALHPKKGYMFWTELGSKTIKRAGMNGASPTIILEQVGQANTLSIDYDTDTLYWTTLEPTAIECAGIDGGNRRSLVTENVPIPYVLTVFGDNVYWGDWTTGDIESVSKLNGTNRQRIHKNLDYIADLKVWHKSRQSGTGKCSVNNGGCSHLCLQSPDGHVCACSTHYTLNTANSSCSEPEEFLMFATKNSLSRVVIGGGDCPDATLPVTGLKNVRAIDYDPVNRHVYWMDDESQAIKRVAVGPSVTSAVTDASVVVSGLTRPFHLVLDVLGRAVYWSCADADSINVTSIDNTSPTAVIVSGLGMMPRHLALHQIKRLLVWIDVGYGGIMRANVDGSSQKELAKAPNATGLTVDQSTGVVYWAVARQIHAIHLDGSNKRVVWQGGVALCLAGGGGSLYWAGGGAAGGDRPLMRLPLARRDAPASPVPHAARLQALVAVHKVARWHPCYGGAVCGGAAGACLAEGTCGCGAGCARAPPPCPAQHFTCDLGSKPQPSAMSPPKCIPIAWKCDGQVDCPDGSDEWSCGTCARGVRCADGACGATLSECATGAPCGDAELPDAFRCASVPLCLPAKLLCDGVTHCDDGSDEIASACESAGGGGGGARNSGAWIVACVVVGGGAAGAAVWAGARRVREHNNTHQQLELAGPGHDPRRYKEQARTRRARPLGASSSDSERYPRETLNPPPSPATESGGAGGRRRAYRHYRAINRPPPPTPCSTDACESDYAAVGAAPPPTPCLTCPPSPSAPSSRSSTYFAPHPPPPSPAPNFSDS